MYDSVIAVGGWPVFVTCLLIGLVVMSFIPDKYGWFKFRWLVFWMLWNGLTPMRPTHIDLPLMLAHLVALELAWWYLMNRKKIWSERPKEDQ